MAVAYMRYEFLRKVTFVEDFGLDESYNNNWVKNQLWKVIGPTNLFELTHLETIQNDDYIPGPNLPDSVEGSEGAESA